MSADRFQHVALLAVRLRTYGMLAERGYEFSVNDEGDLLVCHRGHWRGMWRFSAGQFCWIVAGSREPSYCTEEIEEAEVFSVNNIYVD